MIDPLYAVAALIAMAAVTIGLRALPFVAAGLLRGRPWVDRLSRFAPPTIMTLLLAHSLVDAAAVETGPPWRAATAIAATIFCQRIWRQPLISIVVGTALYVGFCNFAPVG